jgi:tRNA-Thr(GGU) m(6)t(6)A37 methyltransferase TsaA
MAFDRLELVPIGVVHSPWTDKRSAPRQPAEARDVPGTIELAPRPELEHALSDLTLWSHIWVIFWFHLNEGWRPKVLPPRSRIKRGVFATRAPHRPNPLGLSVLRLSGVEGRVLSVRDLDILDGTPVLDLKPYVAYSDALAAASGGWLDAPEPVDPGPRYAVGWSERAQAQLAWLQDHVAFDLRALAEPVLASGPAPHPYRRIRARGDHFELGVKDFRLRFQVAEPAREVRVVELATGYRASVLSDPSAQATESTPLSVHRAFVELFSPAVC